MRQCKQHRKKLKINKTNIFCKVKKRLNVYVTITLLYTTCTLVDIHENIKNVYNLKTA